MVIFAARSPMPKGERSPQGRYVPMILFEAELAEYLCHKTFLISLAGHGQVEDHRCDTFPGPTAFVGGETKPSANDTKCPEHSSKVMRLEGTGT
jgi:hypothetical protein